MEQLLQLILLYILQAVSLRRTCVQINMGLDTTAVALTWKAPRAFFMKFNHKGRGLALSSIYESIILLETNTVSDLWANQIFVLGKSQPAWAGLPGCEETLIFKNLF